MACALKFITRSTKLQYSEEMAATIIQRRWLKSRKENKRVPNDLVNLAVEMGRLVKDFNEAEQLLRENRVLYHVDATISEPFFGHSSFFANNFYRSHLIVRGVSLIESERPPFYSKYAIEQSCQPELIFAEPPEGQENRSVILIDQSMSERGHIQKYLTNLCRWKILYVANDEYTAFFNSAIKSECAHFTDLPYSYGYFYTCHTFVLNVLRRMKKLHTTLPGVR